MSTRAATPDDYDAYARLMPELGVDDPLPTRERFASTLAARVIVAVEADAVVGYALFELMNGVGYVRNVVSDPAWRRRGVGIALMAALRARFASAGATTWCLNVKRDNAAAIALYVRFGMSVEYRTTVLRMPRSLALPDPDPDLELAPVPATADASIEPRFHLLPGQLASARAKPERQVLQLVRAGVVVGVAVFVASVPGAFPFRVTEPADGAQLLVRLRDLAPADAPFVQVSAEGDDRLCAALLGLGLEVRMELLHLHGALG